MTRDGFSYFIGFQNFPGEDPPTPNPPPTRLENTCMGFIFRSNTAQHKPLVQSEK